MKVMNPNLKSLIEQLYHRQFQINPSSIEELAASGSNRKYFRVSSSKGTAIAAFNNDLKENKAFISFTRHFETYNLPVPAVLHRREHSHAPRLRP